MNRSFLELLDDSAELCEESVVEMNLCVGGGRKRHGMDERIYVKKYDGDGCLSRNR